jgi:hypothetical protein
MHNHLVEPGVEGRKVTSQASWRSAKYIIWGKVMASQELKPWWILWVRGRPWFVLAPKVLQQCTNQLVGWFYASSCEWIVCLSLFLVPSRSSNTPLYPRKCWEPESVPRTLNLSVIFYFKLPLESIKELGSMSIRFALRWFVGHTFPYRNPNVREWTPHSQVNFHFT